MRADVVFRWDIWNLHHFLKHSERCFNKIQMGGMIWKYLEVLQWIHWCWVSVGFFFSPLRCFSGKINVASTLVGREICLFSWCRMQLLKSYLYTYVLNRHCSIGPIWHKSTCPLCCDPCPNFMRNVVVPFGWLQCNASLSWHHTWPWHSVLVYCFSLRIRSSLNVLAGRNLKS